MVKLPFFLHDLAMELERQKKAAWDAITIPTTPRYYIWKEYMLQHGDPRSDKSLGEEWNALVMANGDNYADTTILGRKAWKVLHESGAI